jgi:hypothetical protein
MARSILARSGPDTIATPDFDAILAMSRQRRQKRRTRLNWPHGLAAAAVLVIAVSIGIFTGKANLILNRETTEAPAAPSEEADRTPVPRPIAAEFDDAQRRPNQVAGAPAPDIASTSGAPARSDAAAPPAPEPVAARVGAAVPARQDEEGPAEDAMVDSGLAGAGGQQPPAPVAALGEAVSGAPPQASLAREGDRFEGAARRDSAERERALRDVVASRQIVSRDSRSDSTCYDTQVALESVPVVISCAQVSTWRRDTVGSTEVFLVTQLVGGNEVSLAMVADSQYTPALEELVVEAIAFRRNPSDTVDFRARRSAVPPRVVSTTFEGYRVWIGGLADEAKLRGTTTRLTRRNP